MLQRRKNTLSQVKYGAILSYGLIVLNMLYGLGVTPFTISCLGAEEYGVYKTIAALASSLMVMDLGIGGTIQRYVAKYRSDQQEENIPNFMAMSMMITAALNVAILVACSSVYFCIEPMYGANFTAEQIRLAQGLFAVLSLNMLILITEHALNGLITGYNRFVFGNGVKLLALVVRVMLLCLLLPRVSSALVIVWINVLISILTIVIQCLYIKKEIKVWIKFSHWDKKVFWESGKYTVMMFLTSLVAQVFSNIDNVLIGSYCGPEFVTVYSIGLLFFGMFQSLSAGIAGVMLPTVTSVLSQDDGDEKICQVIIQAGKIQFILLGAALIGFVCIGKDFVNVWLGEGYEDVYPITLILLIPSIFELCINVCLSVLRAKNRLGFRTAITFLSAILNIILTIVMLKMWNYIGAAVATACSYILCSLIAMNIYYIKVIKLPMLKIYSGILKRTVPCLVVAGACLYATSRVIYGSWLAVGANVAVFCLVYGGMLLWIGLEKEEKKQIPLVGGFFD